MQLSLPTIESMKKMVFISGEQFYANIDPVKLTMLSLIKDKSGDNKLCQEALHTPIIFHTHSLNNYAYPNLGDILKVVKQPYIKYSLIATKWGIWKLESIPEKYSIYKSDLYKKIKAGLATEDDLKDFYDIEQQTHSSILSELDKIYTISYENNTCKNYDEDDMSDILIEVIKTIQNKLPLKLTLYTWQELEEEESYILVDV